MISYSRFATRCCFLLGLAVACSSITLSCRADESSPAPRPPAARVSFTKATQAPPSAVTMDRRGNLYIADPVNGQVVLMYPDGSQVLFAMGLRTPTGMAVDSKGRLYVSEGSHGTIQCIRPNGIKTLVAEGLCRPSAIVIDRDGDLIVACPGDGAIAKIKGVSAILADAL
ncbi:hypothetical protein [Desulfoluna spongiiphila]|uniref:NHL repeat-containing protein n=1 Tax=Desulfoluna spongiiphila TaxID=419481 RepID=A0A1G5HCY0_9BACT|nr:hypothetical protein [Desulfoluna spongiiphila]SCY61604.1 NHL repeat-containing protein [Desulfoluna spongiiphila]VVS94634.1 prokaryotic membrane lipoprotein lipid attachment site profile [Desulfoluna spongiiphila]